MGAVSVATMGPVKLHAGETWGAKSSAASSSKPSCANGNDWREGLRET